MPSTCTHPLPETTSQGGKTFDWCPVCGAMRERVEGTEQPWRLPETERARRDEESGDTTLG